MKIFVTMFLKFILAATLKEKKKYHKNTIRDVRNSLSVYRSTKLYKSLGSSSVDSWLYQDSGSFREKRISFKIIEIIDVDLCSNCTTCGTMLCEKRNQTSRFLLALIVKCNCCCYVIPFFHHSINYFTYFMDYSLIIV